MRNVVHNRAALLALALAFVLAVSAGAQVTGLYYKEVEKNGRVYVFNTSDRAKAFEQSGEIGVAITLLGRAEGGKTLVGENEAAIDLYLFKHNLPGYERPTAKPAAAAKYPATKIGGRVFADFTDKEIKDKGADTHSKDTGTGLDVKRFYFTASHDFDETWSALFQSDIGDVGAKRYDVFVKKAYIQAKASDAFIFRAGSADTPWVPFVEGLYGMRYFEQTIIDSLGFGTSADWGLHVLGKAGDGMFSYQFSVLNGKGYSSPARSKSVDLEGRIAFVPVTGLTFAVGGYTGKLGNDTKDATPVLHTASRFDAVAAYSNSSFGLGLEYFQASNWKNVTAAPTDKADGTSAWISFVPAKDWKIFGRYDQAKPSKDVNSSLKLDYYNLGIERRFNKSVAVSLAWKHAEGKGGVTSTGNGSIGSTVTGAKGEYNEFGVWALYDF